jgi:hypothetical protein
MVTYYNNDIAVLESLRTKMQEVPFVWCSVYFDVKTNIGVKITVSSEFDTNLSEKKEVEVLKVLEKFCSDNKLDFTYDVGKRPKEVIKEADSASKCSTRV